MREYKVDLGAVETSSGGANCAHELVISNPGTLSTTPSPPWQSGSPRRLIRLKVLVGGEVDTADVVIDAYNNSDTIATMTLPANANTLYVEEASLNSNYTNFGTDGQFLTFAATDIGDGVATRVTIIAYFTCGIEGGSPPDPPGEIQH